MLKFFTITDLRVKTLDCVVIKIDCVCNNQIFYKLNYKMSQLVSMGAFNKLTGQYFYPKEANKNDNYVCPDCNEILILCQGNIRVHHFRHKKDNLKCNYYSGPAESKIHNDAKMLMKKLLENKEKIICFRECNLCNKDEIIEIPELQHNSEIYLEYKFNYNDKSKIADVAHVIDNQIMFIFEICNTHKTEEENRPEPWVEVDAVSLLNSVNILDQDSITIKCIRNKICKSCEKETEKLTNLIIDHLDDNKYKFITHELSLSQQIFPSSTIFCAIKSENEDDQDVVFVNCENNFTENEKNVIEKYEINNLEDIVRCERLNIRDKKRCLKCYKYVVDIYESTGFEPFNGVNAIQMDDYVILIKISADRSVKYIKSLGKRRLDDFSIVSIKG